MDRFLLFILLVSMASCASEDTGPAPSLNADDMWDRMAGERLKPMPDMDTESQTGKYEFPPPPDQKTGDDLAEMQIILSESAGKFQQIVKGLDDVIKGELKEPERQMNWHLMQLHLSRLTSLQKNLSRAIAAVKNSGQDQKMLDKNLLLLNKITARLAIVRTYLSENEF